MDRIEAILFDLDETLMFEAKTERNAYIEACTWILRENATIDQPPNLPERMCDRLYEIAKDEWSRNPEKSFTSNVGISSKEGLWGSFQGRCPELTILDDWVDEYRIRCITRLLELAEIDSEKTDPPEIVDGCIRIRNNHHIPFDDSGEILERLSGSYVLGLLTNGAPAVQRAKLQKSGLESYFTHVVVSGDLCLGKPHPATFHRIAELVATRPSECLMVGDSYEKDVLGARAVGMKALLIDRFGTASDRPEKAASDLHEAYDMICDEFA
jgi:putative hydrolase of the HAD superfamily